MKDAPSPAILGYSPDYSFGSAGAGRIGAFQTESCTIPAMRARGPASDVCGALPSRAQVNESGTAAFFLAT